MILGLDTNVVIDLLRNRKPIYRTRLADAQANGISLNISSIVVHELMFGAMVSTDPADQIGRVDELVSRFQVHDWSAEDAIASARIRADLRKTGQTIGGFDGLIAGQALARGWTLVTGNLREFVRVQGLPLIHWAVSDQPLDRNAILTGLGFGRK